MHGKFTTLALWWVQGRRCSIEIIRDPWHTHFSIRQRNHITYHTPSGQNSRRMPRASIRCSCSAVAVLYLDEGCMNLLQCVIFTLLCHSTPQNVSYVHICQGMYNQSLVGRKRLLLWFPLKRQGPHYLGLDGQPIISCLHNRLISPYCRRLVLSRSQTIIQS
jgi:hypothetical protein